MSNIRRVYTYAVCTISLQAIVWAVISLLRNLLIYGIDPVSAAFQIALIVVGMPIFLGHWLWANRSIKEDAEERGALLRRVYLYGNMAGFLVPFLANAVDLTRRLIEGTSEYQRYGAHSLPKGEAIIYHLVALMILAAVWFYHQRVNNEDVKVIPEAGDTSVVRRLYVLGFSAAGLILVTSAIIQLILWVMMEIGGGVIARSGLSIVLADGIARLTIGLPLWILFWLWAQRLFNSGDEEETSALRKLYLYAIVFVGSMGTVANVAGILAGVIRYLLAVPSSGSDIRQPLSVVIGMGMLWTYHAFVLRDDALKAGEAPRAAGLRRLHSYLIAAVGLSALLVGISGNISVILRGFEASFGRGLREEFSWFTAACIAGLPVWIIPWVQTQAKATTSAPGGADERRSIVRKIYLYFFLFLATMTILSSAVYILYRILQTILGESPPSITELGHAISFGLIASAVWLYHGYALRSDGKIAKREHADLIEGLRVAVVDVREGGIGQEIVDKLRSEIPNISLEPIILSESKPKATPSDATQKRAVSQLEKAGLIVGPWEITVAGAAKGAVSARIAKAVISSPARKILIPLRSEGWDWAGVDRWDSKAIAHQSVRAVKQVLAGEEVMLHRPMGGCAIAAIVIGSLIVLSLLAVPLLQYFAY